MVFLLFQLFSMGILFLSNKYQVLLVVIISDCLLVKKKKLSYPPLFIRHMMI